MFNTWEEQIKFLETVSVETIEQAKDEIKDQHEVNWLSDQDLYTLNDIFDNIESGNIAGAESTLKFVDTYLRDKVYDLIKMFS
ncbi:MAG: hypothetical protein ACI35R_10920 [Bacillus sp. (in: firmicutes)]